MNPTTLEEIRQDLIRDLTQKIKDGDLLSPNQRLEVAIVLRIVDINLSPVEVDIISPRPQVRRNSFIYKSVELTLMDWDKITKAVRWGEKAQRVFTELRESNNTVLRTPLDGSGFDAINTQLKKRDLNYRLRAQHRGLRWPRCDIEMCIVESIIPSQSTNE